MAPQGRRQKLFFENSDGQIGIILVLPVDKEEVKFIVDGVPEFIRPPDFEMGKFYYFNISVSRADDVYAVG
jgi:hypothetical protein